MTDKVFVVNLEKHGDVELHSMYHMPISELEKISDFILTPKQAVEQLNAPEFADFNPEEYQCVYRENV